MNARLPAALAQALAPFAPPQSDVHSEINDRRRSATLTLDQAELSLARENYALVMSGHLEREVKASEWGAL